MQNHVNRSVHAHARSRRNRDQARMIDIFSTVDSIHAPRRRDDDEEERERERENGPLHLRITQISIPKHAADKTVFLYRPAALCRNYIYVPKDVWSRTLEKWKISKIIPSIISFISSWLYHILLRLRFNGLQSDQKKEFKIF